MDFLEADSEHIDAGLEYFHIGGCCRREVKKGWEGVGTVDNDLVIVWDHEAIVARLMAGDQPVGVDHLEKAVYGGLLVIAAPGKAINGASTSHVLVCPVCRLQDFRLELVKPVRFGRGVDHHDPILGPDSERVG